MLTTPRTLGVLAQRAACCLALTGTLLACQTPPPPPEPPEPSQQEKTLLGFGFEPVDGGWELQMAGKLLFDFDSAEVKADARQRVLDVVHALMDVGIARLRVEGHTDRRGSDAYNLRLSQRRAQAVADVLIEGGMARENIEVKGLGRALPIDAANDEENRRVAIIVPLE